MTAGITVRDLRPEEHDALGALTVAAYKSLLGEDLDRGYVAELADVSGRDRVAEVLVAVDDHGALLGGITFIPRPGPLAELDGPDQAGLRMLAVAPGAQGRGAGAALVAAGVERAVAAGKRRLVLHTTAPMATARRLYERAGFRRDPRRDRWLDDGLHLLAYALDLDRRAVGS